MAKQQLIIAEKPSVARVLAKVLSANQKKTGYYEGNGSIVSWCVGHLVSLASSECYDEKYQKWSMEHLPILPNPWQYSISPATSKQYELLHTLMNDERVERIICATDAGREGELIFRLVYNLAGCQKPVMRLWVSSMEESALKEGFQNLKPDSEYETLYQSALCRAKADWLIGVNATRMASLTYGQTLNIGRVMTPTLAMIAEREAQISAFKPSAFYHVQLDCGMFLTTSERIQSKVEAERIVKLCDGKEAKVATIERKSKQEMPPKLYDLTALQRDANRLLGYTAQQTLDVLQGLYEKKLTTYPRTDSRFLTTHMADGLPALASKASKCLPFLADATIPPCNSNLVINDQKVSDHHAIIPTLSMDASTMLSLTACEQGIMTLILVRLLCALGDAYQWNETAVALCCEGVSFGTAGKEVTQMGWKEIEISYLQTLHPETAQAPKTALPTLNEQMTFLPVSTFLKTGKTSAPKHLTEDTLLSAMETAGACDMPTNAKHKGLGTPATRAGVIEKLISTGMVERKGNKKSRYISPTEKGNALITVLPEELQSALLTADWEEKLQAIQQGELTPEAFLQNIEEMTTALVQGYQKVDGANTLFPSDRESLGKCPRCGESVIENKKGFCCSNRACGFAIWKENRFFAAKKKMVTKEIVTDLLTHGKAPLVDCYSEKTGKLYNCLCVLEDTGEQFVRFKVVFE